MTEKRFKTNEVGCIVDYQDNLKNYDGQEIVDLLNELHEKNQMYLSEIKKLHKENRELEEFRYLIFKRMDELMENQK